MKPKVLLIDDDHFHTRMTALYFQRMGWAVLTAANGEEGLKIALTDKPGVIIVDYSMPLMNGYEFTVRLHTEPGAGDIPVLMLSGCEPGPEIHRLSRTDPSFLGFLAKPATFPEIEALIRKTRRSGDMPDG